jgi:predicted DNA-binding transcriptional regulator AlpA
MPTNTPTPATSHAAGGIVPELLTTRQAAELAGVGERTWWAWTRSGLAPKPIAIGYGTRPAIRYRRSEIEAWFQGGCKPVDGRAAE